MVRWTKSLQCKSKEIQSNCKYCTFDTLLECTYVKKKRVSWAIAHSIAFNNQNKNKKSPRSCSNFSQRKSKLWLNISMMSVYSKHA